MLRNEREKTKKDKELIYSSGKKAIRQTGKEVVGVFSDRVMSLLKMFMLQEGGLLPGPKGGLLLNT